MNIRHSALVTLLLTAVAGPAAAQASKIAVVDTERAISECQLGLKNVETLKKLAAARQAELDNRKRKFDADREQLDRDTPKLKPDALDRRRKQLEQDATELSRLAMDYQREAEKKAQEMMAPLRSMAAELVEKIAADGGYELVIEKSAVRYSKVNSDLTAALIQALNAPPKR
ncbi:MAG: OmpH family outer membrane protein [Myxococcota bacterium]